MTIQDSGAIAELIGAAAVLVTLVYLAIQTRMNTKALRAQTHQQIAEARRENLKLFLDHPDLYEAVVKSWTSGVSEKDSLLLRQFTVITARHHENELYQYSQGMIEEDEMESQRRVMLLPHIQLEEVERSAHLYTPAMQEEIALLIARREASTESLRD